MLKKLTSLALAVLLVSAVVGCGEAANVADQAKAGVDNAADSAKGAADEMVPDAAKDTVDGAIDQGSEMAKDGIDKAAGAAGGE